MSRDEFDLKITSKKYSFTVTADYSARLSIVRDVELDDMSNLTGNKNQSVTALLSPNAAAETLADTPKGIMPFWLKNQITQYLFNLGFVRSAGEIFTIRRTGLPESVRVCISEETHSVFLWMNNEETIVSMFYVTCIEDIHFLLSRIVLIQPYLPDIAVSCPRFTADKLSFVVK